MKLFRLLRMYLAVLGIVPIQSFQNDQPMLVFVTRFVVFIFQSVFAILSLVFLVYEAKTPNEYAHSFYGFATIGVILLIFVIFLWKMDSLFQLFADFEKRIEQRMENPESKQKYLKFNESVEKWTNVFYFFVVQVTLPANLMPQFIISFYLYFTTDLGSEAFSLPYSIWAPFDWRTPIGYLIAFTLECPVVFFGCHVCACYITTFTTSCYVIFIFCDEIKNGIHVLDESSKAGENAAKLMKRVGDIVEFHEAAKQLVLDLDDLFALTIVIYFLWGLSTICSTLLVAQIQLEQNASPLEMIKPITLAFWSFALLFLICEFGQMLTDHFNQLGHGVNDCDWTSFPKQTQKVLPVIIQNTQQEVILETFKNASCSRESFKKVVNNGFSYFMVFR